MRRIVLILTAGAVLVLASGCGSSVNFVRAHDVEYEAKSSNSPVEIHTGDVNRPYVVIGTLTASETMKASFSEKSTYDTVLKQLRDTARKVGADALIHTHPESDSEGVSTKVVITAQAVKYMEREARLRSSNEKP